MDEEVLLLLGDKLDVSGACGFIILIGNRWRYSVSLVND